jgi:hypothetical protein
MIFPLRKKMVEPSVPLSDRRSHRRLTAVPLVSGEAINGNHNSPERPWSDPQTLEVAFRVMQTARRARREHSAQRVFGIS